MDQFKSIWKSHKDEMIASKKFTTQEVVEEVEDKVRLQKQLIDKMMGKRGELSATELFRYNNGTDNGGKRVERLLRDQNLTVTSDEILRPGIARKWEFTNNKGISGEIVVDYRDQKAPIRYVLHSADGKLSKERSAAGYVKEGFGDADLIWQIIHQDMREFLPR